MKHSTPTSNVRANGGTEPQRELILHLISAKLDELEQKMLRLLQCEPTATGIVFGTSLPWSAVRRALRGFTSISSLENVSVFGIRTTAAVPYSGRMAFTITSNSDGIRISSRYPANKGTVQKAPQVLPGTSQNT